MLARVNASSLQDLMLPLSRRPGGQGVYFVRLHQTSAEALNALWLYHEAARMKGVIIEGQIGNPDERQLAYLHETLGSDFEPTNAFLSMKLTTWMPRMSSRNRAEFTQALLRQMTELRQAGKPEAVLRNVYFKMMCWLYYRFERLMPFLGDDEPPRILYECSAVTAHELMLLRLLNAMGADVMLLEVSGDAVYQRLDAANQWSQLMTVPNGQPFPADFTLKAFRKQRAQQKPTVPNRATAANQPTVSTRPTAANQPTVSTRPAAANQPTVSARPANRPTMPIPPAMPAMVAAHPTMPAAVPVLTIPSSSPTKPNAAAVNRSAEKDPEAYFQKPKQSACTNAWMKQADVLALLTPERERGDDLSLFYNALVVLRGVKEPAKYPDLLRRLYEQLCEQNRHVLVLHDGLPTPSSEETNRIRRRNYRSAVEMAVDLASNLPEAEQELHRLMQQSFVRTMMYAAGREDNLNRLLTSGVYLLCWIQRYHRKLFTGARSNELPCLLLLNGCTNDHDALYPVFLSGLPVDVAVFSPDLSKPCTLGEEKALLLTGSHSLSVSQYPTDAVSVRLSTAAAAAERDLNRTMSEDAGVYRAHQFSHAEAVVLRPALEEVYLLWDQELKFRTGFSVQGNVVTMPVIYARICGVKNGAVDAYWERLRRMLTPETFLIDHLPMLPSGAGNAYAALAKRVLRNGRLMRSALQSDRDYPFSLLRTELQEHLLDQLETMLNQRLIRGIGENGMEYAVVSVVMSLQRDVLRRLQSFDFTKKNPKLLIISATDSSSSLEDAILLTFLSLVGFDVALFVPTGYQTVERYVRDRLPVEHQAGDYLYDLPVPDLTALPVKPRSWLENLQRNLFNR